MSDKPKRDIKLGELQDECKRVLGCCIDGGCRMRSVCPTYLHLAPDAIDLTDPPRFTEAQRALLKALWAVGVLEVDDDREYDQVIIYTARGRIGGFKNEGGIELPLNAGETLDLAELFGKEKTE